MTQTRTPAARPAADRAEPAGQARDDLDVTVEISPADLLRRLYRFLISKRTGLTLILAMGLLSLVGTLLEQAPDRVRDDPQGYAQWLDSIRPRYGGWTEPLSVAGFFEIFSSAWFKAVTILLAISILACTYHRTPQLWKRAMRPRTHVAESFFDRAGLRAEVTVPVPPGEAIERVRSALSRRRYRTIAAPGAALTLYADRFRFAPFGTVLAHVSFVLILIGVVVSATTGFKNPELTVTVGSRAQVGHGTGLTVEAKSFSDTYHPDGSPMDYASELVLYQDGRRVAGQTVRVNEPLRWGGISIHQSYFGVAAVMRVKDDAGGILFDSGVPLQYSADDGTQSFGKFELPDRNLSVYVVGAASGARDSGIAAGQMQLEIYEKGKDQPVAARLVSQGEPTTISGLTYTFQRERQFTGLLVTRDPGAAWVWTGSALMVLGLILVLMFRHRRIWVRVRPAGEGSEIRLASPVRRDTGFASWFGRFAAGIGALDGKPDERQEKAGTTDA